MRIKQLTTDLHARAVYIYKRYKLKFIKKKHCFSSIKVVNYQKLINCFKLILQICEQNIMKTDLHARAVYKRYKLNL